MEYKPLPEIELYPQPSQAESPETKGMPPRNQTRIRSFFRYLTISILLAAVVLSLGLFYSVFSILHQEPSIIQFVNRTEILNRTEEKIQELALTYQIKVSDGEIPRTLEEAILAAEDPNFYDHRGVDLLELVPAILRKIRGESRTQGATTLTMNLARNQFQLKSKPIMRRKIEEIILALKIENAYSKTNILTMYCNLADFGQGILGMAAAAQYYFGKDLAELNTAEAATLAGIPAQPRAFNPRIYPEAVKERRNAVLRRMFELGLIGRDEQEVAIQEPLAIKSDSDKEQAGPYFSTHVVDQLLSTYDEAVLYDQGLIVHTTLDPIVQTTVEQAFRDGLLRLDKIRGWRTLERPLSENNLEQITLPSWGNPDSSPEEVVVDELYRGIVLNSGPQTADVKIGDQVYELNYAGIAWTGQTRPQELLQRGHIAWFRFTESHQGRILILEQEPEIEGAVLVLESATGAVRALVGGWAYHRDDINRITQVRRHIGTAMMPFIFGAALEDGFTAADTLFDGPTTFAHDTSRANTVSRVASSQYQGIVTLREALTHSLEIPALKLIEILGTEHTLDFAQRTGIYVDLPTVPSLVLEGTALSPIELASAYATIANQGVYAEPYFIESVDSRDGEISAVHSPQSKRVMNPQVAYILASLLHTEAQPKIGSQHDPLGIDSAGKAGTTKSSSDAWFVGFTSRYTMLVWVGYDDERSLGPDWNGAQISFPIWEDLVRRGLESGWIQAKDKFTKPSGIVSRAIEPSTGLLPGPGTQRVLTEVFIQGTEPHRRFSSAWARIVELPWHLQAEHYRPKEGERMLWLTEEPQEATDSTLQKAQTVLAR